MRKRCLIIGFSFLMLFALATGDCTWAKYPERKIRFIAAFAPGGGADIMARAVTKFANPHLGGRLYVENIPGASGAIGFREGAKSAPDGYTLVMMVTSIMAAPHVTKNYPTYNLFDPICVAAQDPTMLSVKTDSRFKTIQDLMAYAKASPGALTVSTAGVGAIDHLYMAALAKSIGTSFNFVPYKGAGPATVAAAGGHAEAVGSGYSEAFSLMTGKKLRPLVVFTHTRSNLFPDVPTAKEMGHDLAVYLWRAVGVPKGVPQDVKDTLVDAFKKAVEDPEFQKMVKEMGLEPIFLGPIQAIPFLKKQDEFLTGIATKIGLEPQ